MSRHGYSTDGENVAMWRGTIASATRGKRGQAFFRSLVEALDAMPEKRLVEGALQTAEGDCAFGCLARARGVDLSGMDVSTDEWDTEQWDKLGALFDIAPQLAQEVMFINDDSWNVTTPEERWQAVRTWAARQIRVDAGELQRAAEA
jgi:hypothetical protein